MLASFLFLFLGFCLGFVVLRTSKSPLTIIELLFWSVPIGIMLLTAWTFAWALVVPHQDIAIVGASITAAIPVFYFFNRDHYRTALAKELIDYRAKLTRQELICWAIVLIPTLFYTVTTVPYLLFFRDGNLFAGWINTWGDWAVHLRNSTFFASSDKLSLENPLFTGSTFHYPYLSSYLSAILQRLDLSLDRSLTWPTVALFASLPPILYSFGQRIINHKPAAVLFSYLVLLAGGLGIYYLAQDLSHGAYFWEASAYSPKLYTDYRINGEYSNNGIWFMNFIISELLPQRAFLSGIGIALYVLVITWLQLNAPLTEPQSGKLWQRLRQQPLSSAALVAGCLFGILPLLHTHSYIALGIIIPVLYAYHLVGFLAKGQSKTETSNLISRAVILLGPATLIGFSLLFSFVFDSASTGTFLHRLYWWVPNPELENNPLIYWLRNAGPLIILGIAALFAKDKRFHSLLLAGAILFIICNTISFQPWHYDNLKIMTYWYILWSLPIAYLITKLSRPFLIAQFIIVLLFTGAGLADVLSLHLSTRTGLQLASQNDLQFAQLVKRVTSNDRDAIIVAATNHDNPLSLASGRRLYVGYEGWLWTYGIDSSKRLAEVKEMYSGSSTGIDLLKNEQIGYLALGPQEIARYTPNVERLNELFPTIVEYKDYKLLKVQ